MKFLDLLPKRVRMTDPDLRVAETDSGKRLNQYMSIKKWVTETEEILVLQGTKMEDKAETQVVLITSNENGNSQKHDKNNSRGNRGNSNRRQNEVNSRQ